jgi:3,4-dihydroxy 2-butanone 4-phosphate synthase/GTP cyclohydrolase II
MNLMTNNPAKYSGLRGYGLAITHRIPVISPVTKEKRTKMGHVYGPDLQGIFSAGGIDDELNKPETS